MIGAALALVLAGMLVVRHGWSRRNAIAWVGWAAVGGGLLILATGDGAWGVAVGTVAAMMAALVLLLHVGWTSPAKRLRPPREAPATALSRRLPDLARRFAVFTLVVPVAFAAAQWLAFGAQAAARRGGIGEADAIALTLILQPILWSLIMTVQMTRTSPPGMVAAPAAAALLGTILWEMS